MVLFAVLVFAAFVFGAAGCGSYRRAGEWEWQAGPDVASVDVVPATHPGQAGWPEHRRLKAALERISQARVLGASEAEVRRLAREAVARGDLAPDRAAPAGEPVHQLVLSGR